MGAAHPERNKENPAAQTNRGLLNKQGGGGVKVGAIHLGNTAWKQVRSTMCIILSLAHTLTT